MVFRLNILLAGLLILGLIPCQAYLDTTPSSFKKPKPMKVKPYKYTQSKTDKYVDIAKERVASRAISAVIGGPAAAGLSIGNKILDSQAKTAE